MAKIKKRVTLLDRNSTPHPIKQGKNSTGIKPVRLIFTSDSDENISDVFNEPEICQPNKKAKITRQRQGSYLEQEEKHLEERYDVNENNVKHHLSQKGSEKERSRASEGSTTKWEISDIVLSKLEHEPVIEKIDVLCKMPVVQFYETDSDSSDDFQIFVPSIVKNVAKFNKQCQINVPNYKIDLNTVHKSKNNKRKRDEDIKVEKGRNVQLQTDQHEKNYQTLSLKKKKAKNNKDIEKNTEKILLRTSESETSIDKNLNELEHSESENEFFEEINDISNNEEVFTLHSSNVNDILRLFITKDVCIFVLKHPSKLYFSGKLSMSIISGEIKVLGHIFKENSENIEIFSPKGNNIYLETHSSGKKDLSKILKNYNISETTENFKNFTVIILKNIKNKILNCFENYFPQQIFPKIFSVDKKNYISHAEMKLQSTFRSKPLDWDLQISENWEDLTSTSEDKSVVMVCGGKNVGKSTLLRYMVNKLLNKIEKVAYIDLDVGQPEFTISGCVSVTLVDKPLLGPNYTHLRTPDR